MKLLYKNFNSCQSVGNARFSNTGDNFYQKRYNIRTNIPNSDPDYKSLFKQYYKSKNNKNCTNLSSGINNHYLKFQDEVKNYLSNDNNRLGLKLEGNKQLENYSINRFTNVFNKECSARERILQHQILNYFYPTDNNIKLMGEKMKLTPIPCKRNSFLKNKKEKDDYTKAKRAAVCMRRLEYTHGLKKNKSQEFLRNNTEKKENKIDLLSVVKGAILIIEDWWIKIMKERKDITKYDEINDDYFKEFTGRSSTSTIPDKIIGGLNSDRYYNNFRNENSFIEDWLIRQSMRLIQKKEKNSYRFNSYEYNSLTSKSKNNKIVKSNNKVKNKKSYKLPKNKSAISSPTNKKHINNDRKTKKNYNITYHKKSEQNPIKVIQSSVTMPFESQNDLKSTSTTASNYLVNSFKDYCLNGNNKFRQNSCSNKKLKSFEIIESRYQKIKYRNSENNQFPFTSRSDFLEKTQDRMTLYKSSDKIRACLNDKNKKTQLNLENNNTISNNGNYGINLYYGNNGTILNVGNNEANLNGEIYGNEKSISINTNININLNENLNSIPIEENEKIKYENINSNNQSELFNNLNDEDITNEKNDDEVNDKKNRDNSTNMVTINNGNIDISETIEEENKKARILRSKNPRKNNLKENENINIDIKNDIDYNNNIKNNINDDKAKNNINDNINGNINNNLNQNISENSINNRNLIENLNEENNDNNIINTFIKINKNDINNNKINNRDIYSNDNQNNLININNKDTSSDIEPIIQDNFNNILDGDEGGDNDNNIYDDDDDNGEGEGDINSNLNINKIIGSSKRKYKIKYNITKSQNNPKRKNSMSEKSSMDGSVDEIITKKLIEIHNRNNKYVERINNAYNQVKSSKEFNHQKGTFLDDIKLNNSGSIHNIEETEY